MQTQNQTPLQGTGVYKELSIHNHNNKLATECFIVIDLSPGRNKVPPRSVMEGRLYSASHDGETIFVKIIDMLFIKFHQLTDHITLWANGLSYIDFKKEFFEKHNHAVEETEVIVYYYRRVSDDPVLRQV